MTSHIYSPLELILLSHTDGVHLSSVIVLIEYELYISDFQLQFFISSVFVLFHEVMLILVRMKVHFFIIFSVALFCLLQRVTDMAFFAEDVHRLARYFY